MRPSNPRNTDAAGRQRLALVDDRSAPGHLSNTTPNKTNTSNTSDPTNADHGVLCNADPFALFWDAYPRKVGRRDAQQLWQALDVDAALLTAILQGLARARQSRQWATDGGRYIPNPANWLRGRRWEDQPGVDFTTSVAGMGMPPADPAAAPTLSPNRLALILGRNHG